MDILEKLNNVIWDMDTKNRMPLIMRLRNNHIDPMHLIGTYDDAEKIKKLIINYFEDIILNSDEILKESVYQVLFKYYKESSQSNIAVKEKITEQAKKNKFKNFYNKDLIAKDMDKTQGERVKEIRTALGYKQEAFAKLMGFSKQYLSRIENNTTQLSSEKILLMVTEFNTNANYILAGVGGMFL